ncbi:polyprenyl synthetase family protein [Sphaerisporangium sp. TRM90804]|uniref:polyprenyl synthetase family protein n=1 Tax=Sphaerisporangium sp. TRM90804 TaxID=3031113 RepID=UPI00244C7892|nr:polyprenyl synthetase family protein [Sphaerisporangium sp. TRM90804]MDH2429641.1 polyprenyl synthetase family protein [Sphaerisporangium sp. TRM90804]
MVMATRDAAGLRELVDQRLGELLEQEMDRLSFLGRDGQDTLRRHLADFVRDGGKRLRPRFVYWGHRAAGGSPDDQDAVLAAGCAVELLHAGAMILDDVMDEAGTRRGRETAHLALAGRHRRLGWWGDPGRFGESMATLFGILAFTWADAALLGAGPRLAEALEVFTRLRVEIIGGQYLDVAYAARGAGGAEEATRVATYKSGKYTVERPLHLGHAIAGGDPGLRAVLSAYALPLGEAFQLRDDVLGVFGDPALTGKPAGADLRQGKRTYLTAKARQHADAYGAALLDNVRDEADVAAARELIVATGALDAVERRISLLAASAVDALDGTGIPPDARAALADLADAATGRTA